MSCLSLLFLLSLSLSLLVVVVVEGNVEHDYEVKFNITTNNSTSSPWLKRIIYPRAQARGCASRPWICNSGGMSPQRVCCNDRCVDVTNDPMNCAFCGVRCPFSWLCCQGACVDVNVNPFHCGRCSNRCAPGRMCVFGMCGYAQPGDPPFPFPFPPGLPGPPFPFPPGLPGPPFPFPPGFPGGPTLPKQDA